MSSVASIENSSHPRVSEAKEVFECPWFHVHEEKWENPSDLDPGPFYRIESLNSVLVLALTSDGEIILVRQFRHAIRATTLEIPAGSIEGGETPEQAAERELLEETGYRAGTLRLVGNGHIMMNRYSARDFLFLAEHSVVVPRHPKEQHPDVLLLSLGEFKDLVIAGGVTQIPALSLFCLVEWKLGSRLVA